MERLKKLDSSFNEEMFKTKVNNIFVMLHHSIMLDELDRVRHFLSLVLEKKYENLINQYNNKNLRRMFDELNVKETHISKVEILDDKIIINVVLVSRYMDYFVDKNTGEYVSGNNKTRVEKYNTLIFEKNIGVNYKGVVKYCPGCGASLDINRTGKCHYCGTIFNAEDYDWILTCIDTKDNY